MPGPGPERISITHPDFQVAHERLTRAYLGMPNPRDRYARLREIGVPLSVVAHIDCEGLPTVVSINTIRKVESFSNFARAKAVATALTDDGRVEFPEAQGVTGFDLPGRLKRIFDLTQALVPYFLCGSAERGTLLREIVGLSQEELLRTQLVGSPHRAALDVVTVAERDKFMESLQQGVQRLQEESSA